MARRNKISKNIRHAIGAAAIVAGATFVRSTLDGLGFPEETEKFVLIAAASVIAGAWNFVKHAILNK